MLLREGPIQIYERARFEFAKSLMDGIDLKNAAAEFHFSLLNLYHHDAIAPWGEHDWMLQKMSDVILKENASQSTSTRGGGFEGIRETEGNLSRGPWKGRIRAFRPPVVYENGKQTGGGEQHLGHIHGEWPQLHLEKPGDDNHFANEHTHSSDIHPLLQGLEYGTPQFVEELAAFYLRPDPHTPSLAEKEKPLERKYETMHGGHPITQPLKKTEVGRYITQEEREMATGMEEEPEEPDAVQADGASEYDEIFRDLEVADRNWHADATPQNEPTRDSARQPFLGPLLGAGEAAHGAHKHDIYNLHFQNWLSENPDVKAKTAEEEWNARQQHFREMAKEWTSGEDFIDSEGKSHSSKLGWLGYMGGLEFLTPQQRTEFLTHVMENGSDYNQNSPHMSIGRFKRNMMRRMFPEYLWYYRYPHMVGPNKNQILEKPYKGEYRGQRNLNKALKNLDLDGRNAHDFLLESFNDYMDYEDDKEHTEMPFLIPRKDGEPHSIKRQRTKEGTPPSLSAHVFNLLAGYDEDGDPIEAGEHPLFPDWEGPLLTPDQYMGVIKESLKLEDLDNREKSIRNAALAQRGARGPSKADIEKLGIPDIYHTDTTGGHSDTFASHWHRAFSKGGANRSLMSYLEKMHNFLTTGITKDSGGVDVDGQKIKTGSSTDHLSHSFLGTGKHNPVTGELESFEIRPDMLGVFASVMPPSGVHTSDDLSRSESRLASILNMWDKSGTTVAEDHTPHEEPRTSKNNFTLTASSSHPVFTDKAMRIHDTRRKKELGVTTNRYIGGRQLHTYDPFTRMESSTEGHINPRMGDVLKKRMIALLGRMHPPGSPMGSKVLKFSDITKDLVDVSKIPYASTRAFSDHQGLTNYPMEGMQVMDAQTLDMVRTMRELGQLDGQDPHKVADKMGLIPPEPVMQYTPEQLEELSAEERKVAEDAYTEQHENWVAQVEEITQNTRAQMKQLPEMVPTPEEQALHGRADEILHRLNVMEEEIAHLHQRGTDENGNWVDDNMRQRAQNKIEHFRAMNEDLRDLEVSLDAMPTRAGVAQDDRATWFSDKHNEMMGSHFDAITNVVKQLIPQWTKEHPDLFPDDDPQRLLSNALQAFRFGQRYMMEMPHEHHGQTGLGYDVAPVEQVATKDMPRIQNNPFAQMAGGAKGLASGRTIQPDDTPEQVMEKLGLDSSDSMQKKHAQEILNALGGKPQVALRASEIYNAGMIPNVEPISGDMEELVNSHDPYVHGGLRQLNNLFRFTGDEASAHGLTWVPGASYGDRKDMPNTGGSGRAPIKRHNNRLDAMERLNSFVLHDPEVESPSEYQPEQKQKAQWIQMPLGPVGPNHNSVLDLLESGRLESGWLMAPDFWPRFNATDGSSQVARSSVPVPTRLHSVPAPYLLSAFPQLEPHMGSELHLAAPNFMTMSPMGSDPLDDPNIFTASEDLPITSLMNPDILLKEASENWAPPIRPMHRIFDQDDLAALKGFSGDWVISRIPQGERLIVSKEDGKVTVYDENGKTKSLDTGLPGSLKSISDDDYVIDGILSGDNFQILDILKHQKDDVSDLNSHERVKLLRAHYSSNEHVELPAPHNTRTADEENLAKALENLQENDSMYLLRDAQSTYMKGERRHPKWILLRSPKELNFIVLDRKGKGPYSYRLGAGPLIDNEGLGNRAKSHDEKPYMDIGTIVRSQKPFNIGDIVNVGIDSVTQSTRNGRDVYTIQAQDIEGEGFGEGPASLETLSLLTKSYAPIQWPHGVTIRGDQVAVTLPALNDEVLYKIDEWPEGWLIHSPQALMGDMSDNSYSIRLSESVRPFWSPVAAALLKGLEYEDTEKKEEVHESSEEAEPLIEPKKIKDTFHKPTVTKALEVALRALEVISKERTTWTGARGMGMDYGTPGSSPRGPTDLVSESTIPDWDMRERPMTDPEKTWQQQSKNNKDKNKIEEKLETEEGEEGQLTVDSDEASLVI